MNIIVDRQNRDSERGSGRVIIVVDRENRGNGVLIAISRGNDRDSRLIDRRKKNRDYYRECLHGDYHESQIVIITVEISDFHADHHDIC